MRFVRITYSMGANLRRTIRLQLTVRKFLLRLATVLGKKLSQLV
nr:MAG TPA: hypothetical protein [Caudoviricetes sp.]